MSLSLWTRLFNWRNLRRTAPQKMFYATIDNAAPSVVQGASVDVLVTGRFVSFFGDVTPAVNGLPSGVSGAFTPTTLGATVIATTLRLTATGGATPVVGDAFTVTLTPADTTVPVVTINCTCTVVASVSASIAISASPTATSALQGETDASTVTLVRTAYTGDVTLAATGLPTGATAVFSPNPMTGATLTAGVVVTNTVGASTVSNDAWTITASGSGVTDATQAMTHTITSPNVTRGVPTTASAVKSSDFQSFADTTALLAQIGTNESNTSKQLLLTSTGVGSSSPASCISLVTSSVTGQKAMRYSIDNTHGVPNTTMMWFAGYPGMPTTNRTGGVSTAFTDCAVYSEVSYSPGFTTAGSMVSGQGYKQYAIGYSNAAGRTGMEYSNIYDCTYTIGWNNNGNGNFGDVGGSGSSTVPINGTSRPWSASSATGPWGVEQVVCFYTEMRAVDADSLRHKSWTWLKGSEPTALPQLDYTVNIGGGSSLPTANRVAWCENFNQSRGFRYIPDGSYMDVHYIAVFDLTYDSNPLNL
jgi:hypothetical protein